MKWEVWVQPDRKSFEKAKYSKERCDLDWIAFTVNTAMQKNKKEIFSHKVPALASFEAFGFSTDNATF